MGIRAVTKKGGNRRRIVLLAEYSHSCVSVHVIDHGSEISDEEKERGREYVSGKEPV